MVDVSQRGTVDKMESGICIYLYIHRYVCVCVCVCIHIYIIWRERGNFCLWLGDARENCFNLESIIQHDRWIACQQGTKQMERRVYKEDNPPDTNYIHLHLEIFLPDILNSSGLDGREFPRTQCKKCKPPWRTKGLCEKKWGEVTAWQTPGMERVGSYLL